MAIALNTLRESVRDRVFYNLVLFVLLLIVASVIVGEIAVGQEAKIVVDFGLSSMMIFGVLIAVFIGVSLVSRDIERRAIYAALSKPIHRSTFILGKYLGYCLTLLVNTAIMAMAMTMALFYLKSGLDRVQLNIWSAVYLIYGELAVIAAVALFFSCFSSPMLSALLTLLVFLIGRWSPDLRLIAETSSSRVISGLSHALYLFLPNLANFNYINETAHGEVIPLKMIVASTIYALGYIVVALTLAIFIFNRRDFK